MKALYIQRWILYLIDLIVNKAPNTDNMGKLLVMVFAAPCSHDKSCQNLHPDTRTYPQYKSCNVTDFWLRSNLYRDTAPILICNICYILTDLFHLSTLYRDTPGFDKTCTLMAKTTPYPPCTVTNFWLKYQDSARCCVG